MKKLADANYNAFDLFRNQWALVSAGTPEHHNGCTIGWGSLGTIWKRGGLTGDIITVYVHPDRYTTEFLQKYDTFTVSFFPKEYRKALQYMGSHTGRTEDKTAGAGLTPIAFGDSVDFQEANLTFLCKKLYQSQFEKEGLSEVIRNHYIANPMSFPPDENGDWQPHWMFIGEITDVRDETVEHAD